MKRRRTQRKVCVVCHQHKAISRVAGALLGVVTTLSALDASMRR